jgi:hypothetical protein
VAFLLFWSLLGSITISKGLLLLSLAAYDPPLIMVRMSSLIPPPFGDDFYYLRLHIGTNGKYVRADGGKSKSKVDFAWEGGAWEKWLIKEESDGFYSLQGAHGKHLSMDPGPHYSIVQKPSYGSWERWIIEASGGYYKLKNVEWDRHARSKHDDNALNGQHTGHSRFELPRIPTGHFCIKNHVHENYLRWNGSFLTTQTFIGSEEKFYLRRPFLSNAFEIETSSGDFVGAFNSHLIRHGCEDWYITPVHYGIDRVCIRSHGSRYLGVSSGGADQSVYVDTIHCLENEQWALIKC